MMNSSQGSSIDLASLSGSSALLTRNQAKAIRGQCEVMLKASPTIILVLDGVKALSPSFADELFGVLRDKLGEEFAARVKIKCDKPAWKALIMAVMARQR